MKFHENKLGFRRMFSIVCIHNFFNNLIPARVGELSYIYLVKNEKNSSAERGIAALTLSRATDMFAILLVSLAVLLLFKPAIKIGEVPYYAVIISILLIFLISFFIFYFRKKVIQLVKAIIDLTKIKKIRFVLLSLEKIKGSLQHFGVIKSKEVALTSIIYSILTMFSHYFFFYVILVGLGLEISFIEVVIGSIIILIAVILPVQGLAGFGTYEGAWTIALLYLGFPLEISIASSFVIHIIQLAYLIITAVPGIIYYKFIGNKQ
jgi:uncharacterized protein (TIRG00374 family)